MSVYDVRSWKVENYEDFTVVEVSPRIRLHVSTWGVAVFSREVVFSELEPFRRGVDIEELIEEEPILSGYQIIWDRGEFYDLTYCCILEFEKYTPSEVVDWIFKLI